MTAIETDCSVPAILRYGHLMQESEFPPKLFASHFEVVLRKAFRHIGAGCIKIDSEKPNQSFLAACAAWGVSEGLIYNDRLADGLQDAVSTFRLTKEGQEKLLGK